MHKTGLNLTIAQHGEIHYRETTCGLTDAINETWGESLIMKIFLRSVGSI